MIRLTARPDMLSDMDNYPLLDLMLTMLWFFFFVAWLFLLVNLTGDIFRSDDLSGWGKAGWLLFLIAVPVIAALFYIGIRGDRMMKRGIDDAQARDAALRTFYGGTSSPADDLTKLAALRDNGTITAPEFELQKARILTV